MQKKHSILLEEVLNTPAFRLHLTIFCVIITNIWWNISKNMARDNFFSFEYSRKIALTTALWKARKGRDSFILVNTIQFISFKQTGTTMIFSFEYQPCVFPRSDPFFWQIPCSGCNSGIDLVVALEYNFFQLYANAKQISVRLPRFRRSYVKRPGVLLSSHTSYTAFLVDIRCAVQSGHVFSFGSCLSSIIVYLRNLFLLNTAIALRWVNKQKDEKMWNSYP